MNLKTLLSLFLIPFLFPVAAQAQKMTVESMVSTPMDQTANLSENMYKGMPRRGMIMLASHFNGWKGCQENNACL